MIKVRNLSFLLLILVKAKTKEKKEGLGKRKRNKRIILILLHTTVQFGLFRSIVYIFGGNEKLVDEFIESFSS